MPISELQNLREKYPQYNDIDDLTLATKISQKYPQYSDLLDKVKSSSEQQPKSGFFGTALGTTPEELEQQGKWVKSGLLKTAEDIYQEGIAPYLHGASTFALGAPKLAARIQGPGAEEMVFPEQQTFAGKAQRFGAETVGLLGGGAMKLGEKAALKVLPYAPLAGRGLAKTAGRLGIQGLTAGLLQAPTSKEGGILQPEERLKQAGTWGAFSVATPFAEAGIKGAGQVLAKSGRWIAKNVGGITDASVKAIKELGADRVFNPIYAKADYIVQDLAPRVKQVFNNAVTNFTTPIQKFAEEKLKIPANAITTIKKKTVSGVNKVRQLYDDSSDPIYQKIEQGFANKRELADEAYQIAVSNIPTKFGKTIDVRDTLKTMKNIFKGSLGQATRGQQGNRLYQIMQELEERMPIPKGAGTKVATSTQLIRQFRGEKLTDIAGEVRISTKQFMELRDALNNLYRENPYDRNIAKVMNSLYSDGEKYGLTGLSKARQLQKQAFEAEEKLRTALIKEKKLDSFQKLTELEKRKLQEIEKYTGIKFIDDLDALTASRYLDDFNKFDVKRIANDLIKAKNPNWTKYVSKEYEDLLGKTTFKDIFDDLRAHFTNQDFSLVSETPGAGGGFYPSRAGFLRSGIAAGTKKYYQTIPKKAELIKRFGKFVPNLGIERGIIKSPFSK